MDGSKRVALITGASRGIGAATARSFAASNYRVAIVARGRDELQSVAGEIVSAGGEVFTIVGDLVDLDFAKRAIDETCAHFGGIDVLVNNAAWREIISMRHISPESWNKTLQVCLTTPAFLARWAAEHMERNSHGVIVNISSIMAQQVAGISPAYTASKGGLDALTYELASLFGPSGIRVVSLQLGAIDTELSQELDRTGDADDLRRFSHDMIMLRRWGSPEEIAQVIRFLASDDASYITGTTIAVDGGWFHQHFPMSLKQRHFKDDYQ